MAINKKLKKFDTVGDYRNFLTTPDFEQPDVSSIGSVAIPDNIVKNPNHWYNPLTNEGSKDDFYNNVPTVDLEYNPTKMLFVNAKYSLFPTSTKIEFIIDTVTNGVIGCWYKPSTGGTYTKLNNIDLNFYSAYTQNRITNLTFNTIGISNLNDECNIIYELRASSTTDASMTASDTCVQRGLISLTGEDFVSSGGSLNYELKTAPDNPWKITNTNSWLTFSTLTGVGPTTIVITATQWSDVTQGRTGNVTLEYTDMEYSVQTTIRQNEVDEFFYVGNTLAEATTSACTYGEIVGSADTTDKYFYYKMTGYTLSDLSFAYDAAMFNTVAFDISSRVKFTLKENDINTDRTGIIYVKNGTTIIAQVTVTQAAKPVPYVYVGNTLAEATTSACTYAETVSSGVGSYVIYYQTNYTSAEIGTLSFQTDVMFQNILFVTTTTAGTINVNVKENSIASPARSGNIWIKSGSTNVAKITFNQEAGEAMYFYWDDGSTSATTKNLNALSDDVSVTCQYVTNYENLTTATTDTWIISATLINGVFTVNFSENPDTTVRVGDVYVKYGNTTVGTLTITQNKKLFFLWSNDTSAITQTVSATETTSSANYTTNYTGLIVESAESYNWIVDKGITNPSGNGTFSATTQQNTSTTTRTAEFRILTGSTTVGEFILKQNGIIYDEEYLTFITLEDGTFKFIGNYSNVLKYSLDNGFTWNTLPNNTDTPTISSGSSIMWKGNCVPTSSGIGKFASTGQYEIEGNIMSLIHGDDFITATTVQIYEFFNLFNGSTGLTSAENLVLPATTLADYCYYYMFNGCTALTTAPELPATTLAQACYSNMFDGCTSLTTAPELSATTLATYCYGAMFRGCTSLTTAPELPATTLAVECYEFMFQSCTSLTQAPELPATTVSPYSYYGMFYGCTSLTTAPELPATTLGAVCYYSMFQGCTSLTTAPELPATTLEYRCYALMFAGCTSLIQTPELPATTLVQNCYESMFINCTSLSYIKCLATDISASQCTISWVQSVATSGTFVKNASMTGWTTGVNGIPTEWTVEDAVL